MRSGLIGRLTAEYLLSSDQSRPPLFECGKSNSMDRSIACLEPHTAQGLQSRSRYPPPCTRPAPACLEAPCSTRGRPVHFTSRIHDSRSFILRASAQEQADAVAEAEQDRPKKRRAPGRQTYRPASFQELVKDATTSLKCAIEDGLTRLEVEFPALPGSIDGEATSCVSASAKGFLLHHTGELIIFLPYGRLQGRF
jgi:hypothetical protein